MTRALLSCLLLGSLVSLGCGDDDDDLSTGPGGAAGSAASGAGGAAAGSGGAGANAGGGQTGGAGQGGTLSGSSGQGGSAGASAGGSSGSTSTGGTSSSGAAGTTSTGGTSAGGADSVGGAGGSSSGAGGTGAAGASSSARWLMGYYPGYQSTDLPPSEVRFDLMTHLAVGAVLPQNDGSLDTTFFKDASSGPAFAKDLAAKAHQAGTKAILMVGGAGYHDGFVASSASAATRATFVTNLVSFAQQNGFDGLDLDWEPLPASEMDAFVALAQDLRAAWPSAVLTVPVNPINPNYETVDKKFGTVAGTIDQFNVMTYSMAGAYSGWKSWHHSPLEGQTPETPTSISTSVDAYLAAGIPAAKLGIGEGFYGLCYTSPVTGPLQALGGATSSANDNQLSYRTLLSTYLPAGTPKWDDSAKAPYLSFDKPTGPSGCTYLSYTNEQSIGVHTEYVKQKGLGGSIVWTINEGHLPSKPAGQRDPLLTALANGLK